MPGRLPLQFILVWRVRLPECKRSTLQQRRWDKLQGADDSYDLYLKPSEKFDTRVR